MSYPVPASLQSLLDHRSHHLATLWEIERTDSTIFRFTDHDMKLDFSDGNSFSPVGAVTTTAVRRQSGLTPHNFDTIGIIDSAQITTADLFAGRYRLAKVTERVVDWRFPWSGAIIQNVYWIGDVEYDGSVWRATAEGVAARLRKPIGDDFTRNCRFRLYDSRCAVTKASFTSGVETVTDVTTGNLNNRIRFETSLAGSQSDDYYRYGELVWQSGATNELLVFDVKDYTDSTGEIVLQVHTPFGVQVGDSFVASAGCNKTRNECKQKFNNFDRHGGFPYIMGSDNRLRIPSAVVPN